MPTADDIKHQQALLATNRQRLAILLNQRDALGAAHAPPGTIYGIIEARENIARIKQVLRGWGVDIDDHPNDEESRAASISEQLAQPAATTVNHVYGDYVGGDKVGGDKVGGNKSEVHIHGPIHSAQAQIGGTQHIEEANIIMGDSFHVEGGISGSNVNFKSTLTNVTQSIGQLPNATSDQKKQVEQLLKELGEALEQIPAENKDDAEAIEELAKELLEKANAKKPKKVIAITADGLKKAAENIKAVLPTVLPIATQIATLITGMSQ